MRSCLNLVLQILYKPKAAIHTDDKVIAPEQIRGKLRKGRCYKIPMLVLK